MKKSQLRKIIKESIGELMNEQSTTYHRWRGYTNNCTVSGIVQWISSNNPGGTGFWQAVGSPSPGQFLGLDGTTYGRGCWEYLGTGNSFVNTWNATDMGYDMGSAAIFPDCTSCRNITTPTPCTTYGCTDSTAMNYNATILPNCDQGCVYQSDFGCTDSTASNYDPTATIDDGSCILGNSGCPTCDSSSWGNHQNWITQFTSMPHFSSSNPNQPCNMICNKIQIWDNNCQNAGPVQANQLACKIEEAQNQSQIHGCNC